MGVAGGEPWRGFAEAYGHELGLAREIGSRVVGLELHWRLTDDPRADALDRDALARHGTELDGAIVPAAPELLLALALHLVAHPDRRLLMVQDIALAARSADADIQRTFELAARARSSAGSWRLALDAAEEYAGVEVERPARRPRRPRSARCGPRRGGARAARRPCRPPCGPPRQRAAALRAAPGSGRLR